jgi:cytochrome bd ubiquinol oxidase subunit I
MGPLLSYETFTAFMFEATFFGVLIFGRSRVPPWFYLFSTGMVALATSISAFWITTNNSWMQAPVGYVMNKGQFVPVDWTEITFNRVVWVRFPHMLLAAFLTGACAGPALLWASCRRLSPRQATGEVRRYRGPLARRAAGRRGPDRVSGFRNAIESLRNQDSGPG